LRRRLRTRKKAVFLLLTGKAKRGSELPFAPFLISGWALAVLIHAL
jgi:prepilin signal peptidase PulO-like enzyme (type II secretory pathway)